MEKKRFFKNKIQMVIYIIIFIICIFLFIVISKTDFNKNIDSDAKRFSSLYNLVPEDNLFIFSDATDVLNIINGRSGVILMGFPSNKWTNYYANILNKVATDINLDKIYYYDFESDRSEANGTYETIVNNLKVYAPVNDLGKQNIAAPTVIVVKKGNIIGYFDETSIIKGVVTPEVYYNENQKQLVYEEFKTALLEYIK